MYCSDFNQYNSKAEEKKNSISKLVTDWKTNAACYFFVCFLFSKVSFFFLFFFFMVSGSVKFESLSWSQLLSSVKYET